MHPARRLVLPTALIILPALAVLPLSGCGSSGSSAAATTTSTSAAATTSASTAPAGLTLRDAWAKAAPSGMTAVFGTLVNPGDAPITVLSGTSPAAGMVELHEVAMVDGAMKMRPKAGGFAVPARGSHELKPGGDHVMLMQLTGPVKAGDEVTVTLTLDGGSTVEVSAIAKDFAGGNETYQPSGAPAGSGAASPSSSMAGM